MKLNNNGWGFIEFFAFLVIFIGCLFATFAGLKKFGLVDENNQFVKDFSNVTLFKPSTNEEKEEKEKDKDKKIVSYAELQENMVSATKEYIKEYYDNNLGVDTLNIRVSQLKKNGFLKELKDNSGKNCSGYVSVYVDDNSEIKYDPYMKCNEYKTQGYESRKDD